MNNAGYTWDSVIQKTADEQWEAMLDIHLTAPFRLLRSAAPVTARGGEARGGRGSPVVRKVVNISSVAGTGGNVGQSGYSAGKAGVIGLTKTLAKEWGRSQITVNAVAFGLIKTRLTEAPAGGDATIRINDRDIKVGIGAELLEAMENGHPTWAAPARRRTPRTPSTCSASPSPTTSPVRSSSPAAGWCSEPGGSRGGADRRGRGLHGARLRTAPALDVRLRRPGRCLRRGS